uniref:Uncharacterized protein n=1 Tax=Myotis myotis TaxID=51298 RepID=A0A7J7WHB4_MYOMY|nr:hypothetical protein mMyoMyo1_012046 [Myotis myotis]
MSNVHWTSQSQDETENMKYLISTLYTEWPDHSKRLNSTAYLSIVADQVHPVMLMAYPNGDGFFQEDNDHATVLVLCRSGFKHMRESLPCLGGPNNHQISVQLSICGMKLKEPSGSWFHNHQISQNWTVLSIRHGVRFLTSPFNISWSQCQEELPQY